MGTTTENYDEIAPGQIPSVGPSAPPSDSAQENTSNIGEGCAETAPYFSAAENPFLFPLNLLGESTPQAQEPNSNSRLPVVAANPVPATSEQLLTEEETAESTWWLLHTKPRQEKKLAEQLARLELPHYLPVTKHTALTRGRQRITRAPLFPGYFFLMGTPEQRLRALETNRLVATHRVDDTKSLSSRLWELADLIQQGVPLTAEARLAPGKKVRVKSGAFQNMEGTVIQRGGKTRLFILVNQLMGGVSLEIEEHLLEPLL